MKTIIPFLVITFFGINSLLGQIKIGDNPQTIDASSVLELESNTKVLVITRVSTSEMNAITPQQGGIVYNTDTSCLHYYNGGNWINLCDAVDFSITNDAIVNTRSTIAITESEQGYNFEVAPNSIRSVNIVDGSINGNDIQDNSITQSKLAENSVGPSELTQGAVSTIEILDGSITSTDIASVAPNQVLTTDENGIVKWEDSFSLGSTVSDELSITGNGTNTNPLRLSPATQQQLTDITNSIANHVATDLDTDATNEIQNIAEVLAAGADAGGAIITGLGTPTQDTDAATKTYVDEQVTTATTTLTTNLQNHVTNDLDTDATNEIQNIAEVLSDGADADGATITGLGTPTQDTDAATKNYVDEQVTTATTTLTTNLQNHVTNDLDIDATNEIQNIAEVLSDGADARGATITGLGTPTQNDDAATKNYVDVQVSEAPNMANTVLTLNETRRHNLNGNHLIFGDSGAQPTGNVGIGNLPGAPQDKLDVDGQIRARNGFAASNGTAGQPSLGFYNDPDTGLYRIGEDQLGFATAESLALSIDANQNIATTSSLRVGQNLELAAQLIDENDNPGNPGDILTATATGTEWTAPSIVAMGKADGATAINANNVTVSGIGVGVGEYSVTFTTPRPNNEYIIQLSVSGNNRIFVETQNPNGFTVEIRDAGTNALVETEWFFTVFDF